MADEVSPSMRHSKEYAQKSVEARFFRKDLLPQEIFFSLTISLFDYRKMIEGNT